MSGPRLLFYSHNGVGVGHLRRHLLLASAFRKRRPDAVVTLVTGSHAAHRFAVPDGIELVRLPGIRKVEREPRWEPREPGVSIVEVIRSRAELLRRTVRSARPDLLVADYLPAGPYGELLGALDELRAGGGRAVAGFRDIVDEPEFVRSLWRRTGAYEVLREHYDAICVYGSREVMDFESDYGIVGELAERLHYVGYLGRPSPRATGIRGDSPTVLASAGGGVDGGRLLSTFIGAAQRLVTRLDGTRLVVAGPLLAERELRELHEQAAGTGIEVKQFMSELDQWTARSALVVTMPGYNTVCELLSSDARAIVVPRAGPSLEQRMRARQLERWGRAVALEPLELDADGLAAAIESSLAGPVPPRPTVALDGIERAVALFEELASGRRARLAVGS